MTTYKVTAATGYRGHKLGDEFEAELSEEEEQRLKAGGSIRVVKRDEDKPKRKAGSSE